jgi:hypothetical protein
VSSSRPGTAGRLQFGLWVEVALFNQPTGAGMGKSVVNYGLLICGYIDKIEQVIELEKVIR